ncbi:MAG: TIGR04086 family membrane protein [Bacilli bacterium]|jgi:putative membrane protein (TIGR04086 family)|nr:TIGR04086 family membrane protein [Bacilli bacterium]MCX4254991.1 TIGR04086 family membrane protein [Bacilli bacterium]
MTKVLEYLKYVGLFFIFIIGIAIITALINLTGLNSTLVMKLGVILTAISFFVIGSIASQNSKEKGYKLGIKLALLFIGILIIINLIMFKSQFNIDRFIYYIILIASGVLGGSFGKNIKFNCKRK